MIVEKKVTMLEKVEDAESFRNMKQGKTCNKPPNGGWEQKH